MKHDERVKYLFDNNSQTVAARQMKFEMMGAYKLCAKHLYRHVEEHKHGDDENRLGFRKSANQPSPIGSSLISS
jgi:hypothetical protein